MHTKRQKFRALLLCAVVFAAVFFSVLLIAGKAGQDCKGAGCHVCAVLHEAEQALDQLGTGAPGAAVFPSAVMILAAVTACASLFVPCTSLVSRKVRLNN